MESSSEFIIKDHLDRFLQFNLEDNSNSTLKINKDILKNHYARFKLILTKNGLKICANN